MTKVDIISGFLGAGKTTFINDVKKALNDEKEYAYEQKSLLEPRIPNDDDLQEQSSKSYSVFTIRIFIAAASILIVFFVSYRTYDYYDTTNLGKEYANTFPITTIVRGETNESVENELATLFENVANNEKLDETITRLSVLWKTAKQDTYNDYTDYAPYIGWYLAIAYLEDYDKDKAKDVLKDMEEMYPVDTAMGDKVREILEK